MAYHGSKGIKRLFNAANFSWQGVSAAWKNEEAFRQEVVIALVLIPVALYLDLSAFEKALMISSILLIMIVEILNSAVEAVVDLVTDEKEKLAGRAKDMGSAAVMLALINAAVIWICIVVSHYF